MLNKLKLSFSFSWSAAMQISWNIRNFGEILHTRKEFYPHRSPQDSFCTPIWPPWREIDLYTPNSNCIIKKISYMFRNSQAVFNQTYWKLIERVHSCNFTEDEYSSLAIVSLSFQFKLMCYTQQLKFVPKVID